MAEHPAADLVLGAYTEHGPWVIDPDEITWLATAHQLRLDVARRLPDLTRPRRVPPGLRVITTVRHLGAAVAAWAVTERRAGGSTKVAGISRRIREAAEALGPTYIKLGQILSSGEGIFPEEVVTEFKKCRDQVPAEPWDVVQRVVEEELGRTIATTFASFERTPVAAASIAQVHRATLLDGTEVVVKVQRPSVGQRVHKDLAVMAWLAPYLVGRIPVSALANPPALVELFAETITEELDFRLEAQNMLDVARSFADLDQRGYVVPRPHPTLVTRRMLVMERLDGYRFEDVVGMKEGGVDTEAVVRTGMIGFMEGAMVEGIFHGDLHAGNLFVLPDGKVALLDFGITGRLPEHKRLAFLALLVGASNNDLDMQLAGLRDLGALPPDVDLQKLVDELGLDQPVVDPTTMSPDELVSEIQRTVKALLGYGARMPKELMLFVKNMVFLDGAIATLAPDLDLFAEITHLSLTFAEKHGERIMGELGLQFDPTWQPDLTGVKASVGVTEEVDSLTYREIQGRRNQIRENLESARAARAPRTRWRR
jgi:ubiquinone biosynthesis protein